jgi:hypothetical protein
LAEFLYVFALFNNQVVQPRFGGWLELGVEGRQRI